ncbi:MAG: leucine-rich repeat domain-containing protein, partial [Anaeroplasmataceae bacterium]|nr:leucine-rich repeat domain-containing protein [Anaeroplasmataceae bacterium]
VTAVATSVKKNTTTTITVEISGVQEVEEQEERFTPSGATTKLVYVVNSFDVTTTPDVEGGSIIVTTYYKVDIYESVCADSDLTYSMKDIEDYIKEKSFDMMYDYLPDISASEISILPEVFDEEGKLVVRYGISTRNLVAEAAIVDYYELFAEITRVFDEATKKVNVKIVINSKHHYQRIDEGDLEETITDYYPVGVLTEYQLSYIPDTAYTASEIYYAEGNTISYVFPNSLVNVTIYDESIIDFGAFMNMSYLTHVSINPEILQIRDYAFYMNYNLKEFNGDYVFTGASPFAELPASLVAAMPEELLYIGDYAFYIEPSKHKSYFLELALNDKVEYLGSYAFYGWNSITTLDVPASVNEIGTHTFAYNTDLVTVRNHSNVFGAYMFSHDEALTTFNSSVDDIIVIGSQYLEENMPEHIFEFCDSITALDIQNGYIADYMFYQCRNIPEVYIRPSVTKIGTGAFAKNVSLTDVYYTAAFDYNTYLNPKTDADGKLVSILDAEALKNANILTYYSVDDTTFILEGYKTYTYGGMAQNTDKSNVESIGAFAFQETLISAFDVPQTTTYIGEGAIKGCRNITFIYMPFIGSSIGNQNVLDATFGWIFGRLFLDGETLSHPKATLVSEGIDNGYDDKETYDLLTDTSLFYPITQSYTNVHTATFFLPVGLKTVIITKETIVGRGAFYNCTELDHIWLPQDSLRQIQHEAFYNCTNLREMLIPNQISSILENTFAKCASLEFIQVPYVGKSASANGIDSVFGVLFGTEEYDGSYPALQLYQKEDKQEQSTEYEYGVIRYYIPETLKMVVIPNTRMNTIPFGAFSNCSQIERIEISGNVRYIGAYAFFNCTNLYDYKKDEDENHPIGFPETILEIGEFAFSGCVSMPDMILSPVLQKIGRYAFQDMTITELYVPNTTIEIGENILKGCYNLETLSVPFIADRLVEPTVETEVLGHFFGTSKEYLENLYQYLQFHQYLYFDVYGEKLNEKQIATLFGIPTDVTDIIFNNYMTADIKYRQYVQILLTGIYEEEFFNEYYYFAEELGVEYALPKSLKNLYITNAPHIADEACANAKELVNVDLSYSNELVYIGNGAFINNTALVNVYLPADVTMDEDGERYALNKEENPSTVLDWIGDDAFRNCTNLSHIQLDTCSELESIGSYAFAGSDEVRSTLSYVTIPVSVTEVGEYAFAYNGLKDIEILNNYIGDHMFYENDQLVELVVPTLQIPGRVSFIGDYAFAECDLLEDLTLTEGLDRLGNYMFYNDDSLRVVVVPQSINKDSGSCADYVFAECSGLEKATILNNKIGNYMFAHAAEPGEELTEEDSHLRVVIWDVDSIEQLGTGAFMNCTLLDYLASVGDDAGELDESKRGILKAPTSSMVDAIGDKTFYNCKAFTSIVIPGNIATIGISAFEGCRGVLTITFDENGQLTDIKQNAFKDNWLVKEIVIPETVKHIGYGALNGESMLESLTLPFIGAQESLNVTTEGLFGYIFAGPEYYNSYEIRQHFINNEGDLDDSVVVTYIPKGLKKVIIADDEVISYGAFNGCSSLEEVLLPDNVKHIYKNAFLDC